MIHVHGPGRAIERLRASVGNGMAVTLDEPFDLRRVLGLCLDIARGSDPSTPGTALATAAARDDPRLRRLYGALLGGSGLPVQRAHPEEADELGRILDRTEFEPAAPFDGLVLALCNLLGAWERAGAPFPTDPDPPRAHGLLALADPLAPGDPEVRLAFSAPTPALLIRPGSLVATLGLATIASAPHWIGGLVGAVRTTWRSPEAAGAALVEGTRAKAGITARHKALARLDQHQEANAALAGRPVAVVLLHGLFSTDLGTFDGLIDRLRGFDLGRVLVEHPIPADPLAAARHEPLVRERRGLLRDALSKVDAPTLLLNGPSVAQRLVDGALALCGWPHDTLAPVEANAQVLADALYEQFGQGPPTRIVLVCHSRGGLVARAAAARLASRAYGDFVSRVRLVVTFGTPHEGSPLAEHDARTLGTYFLLLNATGTCASLLDVLTYLGARSGEGVLDLKPLNAATSDRPRSFTSLLLDKEREAADRLDRRLRVTPVVTVGGDAGRIENPTRLQRAACRLVRWHAGAPAHDLVVPLASSLGTSLPPEAKLAVPSNHFGYFPTGPAPPGIAAGLDLAALCILAEIPDLGSRIDSLLPARQAAGSVAPDPEGGKVIVGGVALEVREPGGGTER